MDDKDRKNQGEKFARQFAIVLENMAKEMEKAAATIGKMGEEAYETMPSKAKTMAKDVQSVIDVVAEDLKEDIPKIQKNMEGMARRLIDYADDVQKAIRGEKK